MIPELKKLEKYLEKEAKSAEKDVQHYVKYGDEEEADFSRGRADAFREAKNKLKDL